MSILHDEGVGPETRDQIFAYRGHSTARATRDKMTPARRSQSPLLRKRLRLCWLGRCWSAKPTGLVTRYRNAL